MSDQSSESQVPLLDSLIQFLKDKGTSLLLEKLGLSVGGFWGFIIAKVFNIFLEIAIFPLLRMGVAQGKIQIIKLKTSNEIDGVQNAHTLEEISIAFSNLS
jgi:hypothetical protein